MNTRKTKYTFQAIADDLRERIGTGEVGGGERLPTEAELAAEYETTRTTARNAYRELINEGLVVRRKTHGYFVRQIKPRTWRLTDGDTSDHFADPWQVLVATYGIDCTRQIVTVRIDHGSKDVGGRSLAGLLQVDPAGLVACRSALRFFDGDPVETTDTYVSYDLVKDTVFLSDADAVDVYALLADAGHRLERSHDTFVFRNPSPSEAARLELPEATGVVDLVRVLDYTAGQLIVVHSVFSAAGAQFVTAVQA